MDYLVCGFDVYQVVKETAKTFKAICLTSYNKEVVTLRKSSGVKRVELQELNAENCSLASTIINKNNMEWGVKKFNYKGQPLNDGSFSHTFGSGSSTGLLSDCDLHRWLIFSTK